MINLLKKLQILHGVLQLKEKWNDDPKKFNQCMEATSCLGKSWNLSYNYTIYKGIDNLN